MTCARTRTYTEHTASKNFVLEHTKLLFNENLRNLYKYFTLLELFKILKYKSPIPITELFTLSNKDYKISLLLPKFNLDRLTPYRALCSVLPDYGINMPSLCLKL